MRVYLNLAAAAAIALVALPGPAPFAGDQGQPGERSVATPSDAAGDTWTAVLDNQKVQPILGKEVRSPTGENMGRIVDVIVDRTGQTRAAVIDFGGFLGVGSRKIVVDWSALHFAPKDKNETITVNLTRDQVKAAPEYRDGKPVVVMGALGASGPEM
jgi:hypothetical protein